MKYELLIRTIPPSLKIHIAEGEILLDVMLQNGVKHPYSCRSGVCGTCRCTLISGKIAMLEYSRSALSDSDRELGFILACRSHAQTDLSIELP